MMFASVEMSGKSVRSAGVFFKFLPTPWGANVTFASVEMSGKSVRSVGHFLKSSPLAGEVRWGQT